MNGTGAIKAALESTKAILDWYVSDFTDAELLVRPVPGANHAAWQIGNVILEDVKITRSQFPDAQYPELSDEFMKLHDKEGSASDGPDGFLTRDEYLALFARSRAAVIAVVESLSDSDLDAPTTGPLANFAPTVGDFFLLIANHTLMHAGQFTVIRRRLGKPVLV